MSVTYPVTYYSEHEMAQEKKGPSQVAIGASLRRRLIGPLRQMGAQQECPSYDLNRWRETTDS
jgi:hypothetical protein